MGQPAAKQSDQVVGTDTHVIMIPAAPAPPVPTPLPHPFTGILQQRLSTNVKIQGMPAATADSIAVNTPAHIPQGGSFQKPPMNQGKIMMGSTTVFINNKPAARSGDTAMTCNDPTDMPVGKIVAVSTVLIG
ncbi:MAG TPA: hypothetical protein G4O15_01650 [Dehalococcoidia bacterium]|nr:hypothetical protein [Dehalococcoidia bacterium]